MIALGFDFDHTLGLDHKLERTVFLELAQRYATERAVDFHEPRAARAIDRALAAFRVGIASLDDGVAGAFAIACGAIDTRSTTAEFRREVLQRVPDFVRPMPGVEEMLQRLDETGVKHAILTNGWSPLQERKAEAIGYDRPVLVSDTIGARKPESAAFAALCRVLEAAPEAVWFVGDDPSLDVCGALASGLNAVWFDRERREYPADLPPPTRTIERMHELLALVAELR